MSWKRTLTQAQRAEIKALHAIEPRWNLMPLAFLGLWAMTAAVVLDLSAWPARVACYVVIGACLNALGILMHETIHGNTFRRPRLDRWTGFLLGLPLGMSAYAYRVVHALHHRHTRSENDPDEFGNLSRNPTVLSIAFYAWLLIGGVVYLLHVPITALRLGTRRERSAVLLEYALIAGAFSAVFLTVPLAILADVWLYPFGAVLVFASVRGWAEHTMTEAGTPLTASRTVTSNRLVSLLMCNLNYHLEHHLYPNAPWYHLPRMHAVLEPQRKVAGSPVQSSYVHFLVRALRTGIHGRLM